MNADLVIEHVDGATFARFDYKSFWGSALRVYGYHDMPGTSMQKHFEIYKMMIVDMSRDLVYSPITGLTKVYLPHDRRDKVGGWGRCTNGL